ncbi:MULTISPECIES: murein hydrolase activator EnvC [unclassified Ectothiorhodospira]|uniref:murein hydrolase activator EnvC family protein n=1 Tax=unclassified Ectothiorhodospira TaxID=2684909 RepID=UPI001EE99652|nr:MULTISPECIES: peptidoglycan DD-metalloendopeptidase family protein [unclassified Ectothiorhodospira]MCG5514697.1 peptidoglycan DD-metalloendopeptidase family protein [Ectothiorhodospira sp. 9100]MCG5518296.1 peptidoglycan DD-metalloendopeptidase family protein [Ectothiorhodospira sp. 9905]
MGDRSEGLFRAITFTALLALSPAASADGTDWEQARERLQEVQQEIEQVRDELEKARGKRGTLEAQLRETERAVSRTSRDLTQSEADLEKTRSRLRTLEARARKEEARLEAHREGLALQLRHAYQAGQQDQLKLILNQEDPARLERMLTYYRHFNAARSERIREAREALADLAHTRQALDEVRVDQARQRSARQRLQNELERRREERAGALAALQADIDAAGQTLTQLESDQQALEDLIESLDAALSDIPDESLMDEAFADHRGQLPYPVPGEIRHGFGTTRASDTGQRWRGLVITAERGDPVRAIHHGRVAFADWMRGFGMLLIVDHGDGYMTLYGHNESLLKSPGDWVRQGDAIAHAGDSGADQTPGVYFEIRHEGQPVNPARWCDSNQRMVGSR